MNYNEKVVNEAGKIKLDNLSENVKIVTWALILIVTALLFALGAIVNDYLAMKQATYLDLRDRVFEQNIEIEQQSDKIDALILQSASLNNTLRTIYKFK